MDIYSNIKDHLIRNEINHRIKDYSKNKGDLETYYEVGKLLVIAQGGEKRAKYGDGLIKEYSEKLTKELGNGYSTRSLKRMRKFYLMIEKGTTMLAQLSWSHYIQLLQFNNIDLINYYIELTITNNLSVRQLRQKIKSKEYERLPIEYKERIGKDISLIETVKEPIIIPNPRNIEVYQENILQKLIIENYQEFLTELGDGYSLVGNEYKIKLGNRYYYIDILLYNKKYRAYVVIELKIGEVKVKDFSQINMYMKYIDNNIKDIFDNETIGIILCHKNNKLIIEYCSNPNIVVREYISN